jgi:hypothetical protein
VASCVSGELCQYRNVVVVNCYVASSDVASSVVASCVVANCVVASCYVANCMGIMYLDGTATWHLIDTCSMLLMIMSPNSIFAQTKFH